MPELPEVETVRLGLLKHLPGHRITDVDIRLEKILRRSDGDAAIFRSALMGQCIADIRRRGKYLLFEMENTQWVLFHLGMTGKLYVKPAGSPIEKHTHIAFHLDNGSMLHFNDVRQFGSVALRCRNPFNVPPLSLLGPEPLEPEFNGNYLFQTSQNHRVAIKTLLLNQHIVAGLGNIYVDEALFAAGVRPRKRSDRITRREANVLTEAIKVILKEAILAGGSTVRDYRNAAGAEGHFQLTHKVYGRGNQPCKTCGTTLQKVVVGGRSSVYCPACQKS